MFLKIFKHAFMRPFKTVIAMLCISVASGILAGLFENLCDGFSQKIMELIETDSPELSKYNTLFSIFNTLAMFLAMAVSILTAFEIVVVYSAFNKAIATDEAYLTYTLPAKSSTQTGARYLSLFVWHVIIFAGAIASYVFMTMTSGVFNFAEILIEFEYVEVEAELIIALVEVGVLGLVTFASGVAQGQCGVVLANALSHKLKRRISSFLVGFTFFVEVVTLTILLVVILLSPLVRLDVFVHLLIWIYIVVIGSLGGLAYYLSYMLMGRRLNVA
ncbi:MAG: hypothetical protein IKA99_00690 [Clostridia bacterium]|nr:hypothetical protein [Clostridia bacterium]